MSLMADALQPFLANGIISLSGRTSASTLPDLLISRKAAYDLRFNNVNHGIEIEFRDSRDIIQALAADFSRFSAASFQTIETVPLLTSNRNGMPWGLVKLYYAAFYAGHAIFRLFGEGCSYLDKRHVTRINEVGVLLGMVPSFTVEKGLYHCLINDTSTGINFIKTPPSIGGNHETFWHLFSEKIGSVAEGILKGNLVQSDAQSVFIQLTSLQNIIKPSTTGYRLSTVRNAIQYRHEFGVWFPTDISHRDREFISRITSQWRSDPIDVDLNVSRKGGLFEFIFACTFIVSLCGALCERISSRSTAHKRSFINYGPIAFLNDVGITLSKARQVGAH